MLEDVRLLRPRSFHVAPPSVVLITVPASPTATAIPQKPGATGIATLYKSDVVLVDAFKNEKPLFVVYTMVPRPPTAITLQLIEHSN
jgi:hypothetical protein